MTRFLRLILSLVPVLLLPSLLHAQRPPAADLIRAIDSIATAEQARKPYTGITVLVARGSEEPVLRMHGTSNLEHGVPVRAETLYDLRSIAKQFTAAAVLQLVDQGRLGLDDELAKFFPDFPLAGRRVTIHHLLTHTSGLVGLVPPEDRLPHHLRLDFTPEEVIAQRQRSGFRFDPGAGINYTNFSYFLLGSIVEKVSGQAFDAYLRQHVFLPLGMTATASCDPSAVLPNRAAGYVIVDGKFANAPFEALTQSIASAGLCSSASDLLRWHRGLLGGQVVSPASLQKILTPPLLNSGRQSDYAYGSVVHDFYGRRRVHHTGGGGGFSTVLAHYPDDSMVVAVLLNTSGIDARRIEQSIALAALGLPRAKDLTLTAEQAQPYTGTYEAGTVRVRITPRPGGLQAEILGTQLMSHVFSLELLHQGQGEFVVAEDPGTRLSFAVAGQGVSRLVLRRGDYIVELSPTPAADRQE